MKCKDKTRHLRVFPKAFTWRIRGTFGRVRSALHWSLPNISVAMGRNTATSSNSYSPASRMTAYFPDRSHTPAVYHPGSRTSFESGIVPKSLRSKTSPRSALRPPPTPTNEPDSLKTFDSHFKVRRRRIPEKTGIPPPGLDRETAFPADAPAPSLFSPRMSDTRKFPTSPMQIEHSHLAIPKKRPSPRKSPNLLRSNPELFSQRLDSILSKGQPTRPRSSHAVLYQDASTDTRFPYETANTFSRKSQTVAEDVSSPSSSSSGGGRRHYLKRPQSTSRTGSAIGRYRQSPPSCSVSIEYTDGSSAPSSLSLPTSGESIFVDPRPMRSKSEQAHVLGSEDTEDYRRAKSEQTNVKLWKPPRMKLTKLAVQKKLTEGLYTWQTSSPPRKANYFG